MAKKNHKQRGIDKTKLEMSKRIKEITDLAKLCGSGELQFFLYYLHVMRFLETSDNIPNSEQEVLGVYIRQASDAYKYIIQMLAKYARQGYIKNNRDGLYVNSDITHALTKISLNLNAKFETLSMLSFADNIEVSGKRDQRTKINFQNILEDETTRKYFNYFLHQDRENVYQKEKINTREDYLENFRNEYSPFSDLFETEFKITLDQFIELINFILDTVISQWKNKEKDFVRLQNGNMSIEHPKNIMLFGNAIYVRKMPLFEKYGISITTILDKFTFNPQTFDEEELRYNIVDRYPILNTEEEFIVSPELLLDSLFVNSHYSLLESTKSKEAYKERYSQVFVDEIIKIANKYGYTEVVRNLELYEGKKQLGDIDIVLKNSEGNFLLIEAKNHSVPMDVVSHDFPATQKRLQFLRSEWESKVEKRYLHLQSYHSDYGITEFFNYIIISKYPEVLAHFSNFLLLTIDEFDFWLSKKDITMTTEKVLEDFYKFDEAHFTVDQINEMQNQLNSGWQFGEV